MPMTKIFDWDSATIKINVPVQYTATKQVEEFELSLESFARLLLTSVPEEWFAQIPVSNDLPLAIEIPDPT